MRSGWAIGRAGMLGGILAVVTAGTTVPARAQPPAATVTRVAGSTRQATALAVARLAYPEGPPSRLAVLVSGQDANLVDALTAAPLARVLGAPILLTDSPHRLGSVTASALTALGIRQVILVGAAANPALQAQLPPGVTVRQELAGATRFTTAAAVAGALAAAEGVQQFGAVMVASGEPGHLVDALAADPAAARRGLPILLAPAAGWAGMPAGEQRWVSPAAAVYAVGAAGSYPFTGLGRPVLPVAGSDRFRTALAVDRVFPPRSGVYRRLVVANGQDAHLVDALSAGPWAAATGTALVLVNGGSLPASTAAFLRDAAGEVRAVAVIGGPASIPPAVIQALAGALTLPPPLPGVVVAYGRFRNLDGTALQDPLLIRAGVTAAAPLWFRLAGTPGDPVVKPAVPAAVQAAVTAAVHARGVQVWPVLQYTAGSGLVAPLARDPAAISGLVQAVTGAVAAAGADGLVLDLEDLPPADRDSLDALVAALAQALHAQDRRLVVTAGPQPYPASAYADAILAASADYLDLLPYPEYTLNGPTAQAPDPGPVEGAPWAAQAVAAALQAGVPPGRLLLGTAAYGEAWTYTLQGFGGGEALGAAVLAAHTLPQSATLWDPAQAETTFTAGVPAAVPGPLAPGISFRPAVQELQALLNTVALWTALAQDQAPPALLATDGGYGPATRRAVAAFQAVFDPHAQDSGVYGPGTARALAAVAAALGLRQQVVWDADSRAGLTLLEMAARQGLGGVSLWALGLESAGWRAALSQVWTPSR
ncbi:exported protein of unknown function [Candidatus Hydrogenisulfobacillus filiaventi]|uniref:GH18 domain-containing protein n=1 Tax=Candidatus Hydrogenisulfobacillus filiaventi TaxID=2707344 RepID=A0A6F8ZI80_9FIRM|nr:exported protein of unknown function [Candidatus Hydrogenisulfobacillus filiaventi]